jgi:hypothetical protein
MLFNLNIFLFLRRAVTIAAQFDLENSISAGISSSILHPQSAPVNIPNSPMGNSLGEFLVEYR